MDEGESPSSSDCTAGREWSLLFNDITLPGTGHLHIALMDMYLFGIVTDPSSLLHTNTDLLG
jgi:hypothetical protein